MKICNKCSAEFNGIRCNACRRAKYAEDPSIRSNQNKAWAQANKDKVKSAQASYFAKNKERIKKRSAIWREKNKDRILLVQAEYVRNNKDKCNLANKKYKQQNREKVLLANKAYRQENKHKTRKYQLANKERLDAVRKAWKVANPNAGRIVSHNRRARIKQNGGRLSNNIVAILHDLQKGKCAICKQALGDKYHVDHIMPIKLGGTNTNGNTQLLHDKCNLMKGATHPVEFMQSNGYLL